MLFSGNYALLTTSRSPLLGQEEIKYETLDVMRVEHQIDDYDRLFDAWEAGGVTGLVVGM